MPIILLLILILTAHSAPAQTRSVLASAEDIEITERKAHTSVSPDIRAFIQKYLSYNSDPYVYVSCNEANEYYRSDTVRMRQISGNYYPTWDCCTFVEWRLISNAEFLWSDLQRCTLEEQRSYYLSTTHISPWRKGSYIYLSLVRNGVTVEQFKLLKTEEAPSRYRNKPDKVLVLLRMPKAQ